MLFKLSHHIANCLELAVAAERRAQETDDPAIRRDNETLAKSWRHLASSYQFVESLDRFLSDKPLHHADAPSPELPVTWQEQPPESKRIIVRRPRVRHELSFHGRLLKAAQEAREQAAELPWGPERDRLLLKAQQCETAAEIDIWISSPGSNPPGRLDDLVKKPKS